MPNICTCKVTFTYDATQPDELDLKVGELITGVDISVEGGWWEGTNSTTGKKGWFPDNFVEKSTEAAKPAKSKPPPPAAAKAHAPAKPAAPKSASIQKTCKCTFAYEATNPDELSIVIGDVIVITKQDEEGWWEGKLNGKIGMFPDNFVEELPAGSAPPEPEPEEDAVKATKLEKVGFGNIFAAGGVPQLRKTGTFSASSKPAYLEKNKASAKPKGVDPKTLDLVKVEFDYKAENDDELDLIKGQFVLVTKRVDQGWWEGDLVGSDKKGMFPDNFVVVASDSEKADEAAKMAPAGSTEPPPPRPEGGKPKVSEAAPIAAAPPATAAAAAGALKATKAPAPPRAEVAKKPPPVSMKKKPPAVSVKKPNQKKIPPPAVEKVATKSAVAAPAAAAVAAPDPAVAKAAEAAKDTANEALAMVKAMKTTMDAVKADNDKMKKQIKMLMSDIDEGTAQRVTMQASIDRLKKLADI